MSLLFAFSSSIRSAQLVLRWISIKNNGENRLFSRQTLNGYFLQMNEGIDDEDDIILDRRNLLHLSSGSGAILSGTHRVTLRRESTPKDPFWEKHLLLAVTCLCLVSLSLCR